MSDKEENVDESTKNDALLFDEIDIDGVKIKQWSLGKLFDVSEYLEKILDKLDSKGLSIDNVLKSGVSADLITRLMVTLAASDEILNIISITIDKDIAEVRDMSMEKGIALIVGIAQQNIDTLKNVLTPLLAIGQEVETEKPKQKAKTKKSS